MGKNDTAFSLVTILQVKIVPRNILSIHGSKVMLFNIDRNDVVDKDKRTRCLVPQPCSLHWERNPSCLYEQCPYSGLGNS